VHCLQSVHGTPYRALKDSCPIRRFTGSKNSSHLPRFYEVAQWLSLQPLHHDTLSVLSIKPHQVWMQGESSKSGELVFTMLRAVNVLHGKEVPFVVSPLMHHTVPSSSYFPAKRDRRQIWARAWPGGGALVRPGVKGMLLSLGPGGQTRWQWWRGIDVLRAALPCIPRRIPMPAKSAGVRTSCSDFHLEYSEVEHSDLSHSGRYSFL